jgi:hypothetical protein
MRLTEDNVMTKISLYTIVALGLALLLPPRVHADPDPRLNAKLFSSHLVQAMDECTSAVTNVGGVGACPTSNVDTDGTHLQMGRVVIKSNFGNRQVMTQLKSSSATPPAALANRLLHTVIVLRVTRTNQAPLVTWVDQVLDCPDIAVPGNGNVLQKANLVDCGLAATLADNTTNKEVIAVQVVDSVSGKVVAVPGIRRSH